MSQVGRPIKALEAPRPLKSLSRATLQSVSYEVQSIEELITLTENVAASLALGQNNADSMTILLANLRVHGPQLEAVSKDTLDRAFVTFRNASQDERLAIIARMNLLELIELRAKSWQISDGLNMYYQHKATDPEINAMLDLSMLDASLSSAGPAAAPLLSPGELLRNSGKFIKPTKIPGKNYSKDEVVIRNADSGKVNPGAKERLVQITGPSEDKIIYAKQLIEDTIRRNASPVRLDAPQGGGSCSSLASSASDEAIVAAAAAAAATEANNRNGQSQSFGATPTGALVMHNNHNNGGGGTGLSLKMPPRVGAGGQQLLHSMSTNDATLGEYKYTVGVGSHSVKITGDCFELVRIAKLVLDDYFSSSDFLASVDAGAAYDPAGVPTPTTPAAHQLSTGSPFGDSGIGLNLIGQSGRPLAMRKTSANQSRPTDGDDDVFIVENDEPLLPGNAVASSTPINNLTRSRRSHFSRKDSTPEFNNGSAVPQHSGATSMGAVAALPNDGSRSAGVAAAAAPTTQHQRIVYEYQRMIYYAKSPHSWALPPNWNHICDSFPTIIRNKDASDQKCRFDADKHVANRKANWSPKSTPSSSGDTNDNKDQSATPDPE